MGDSLELIVDVAGGYDERSRSIGGCRNSAEFVSRKVIDVVSTEFVKQIRSEMCPSSVAKRELASVIKVATEPFTSEYLVDIKRGHNGDVWRSYVAEPPRSTAEVGNAAPRRSFSFQGSSATLLTPEDQRRPALSDRRSSVDRVPEADRIGDVSIQCGEER